MCTSGCVKGRSLHWVDCLSQSLHLTFFLKIESSTEPGSHQFRKTRQLSRVSSPLLLCLRSWGYCHTSMPRFVHGFWGMELKPACLHDKHFSVNHLLSLSKYFVSQFLFYCSCRLSLWSSWYFCSRLVIQPGCQGSCILERKWGFRWRLMRLVTAYVCYR